MTDGDALLAAVLAHPDEDTPRLAYADWLEENGRPKWAGFIRREVARLCDCPRPLVPSDFGRHNCPTVLPWTKNDGETRYWGADGKTRLWRAGEIREACAALPAPRHDDWNCLFVRGFVERVTCSAADWAAHADALLAAHPVRRVTLTTFPRVVWRVPLTCDGPLAYSLFGDPADRRFLADDVERAAGGTPGWPAAPGRVAGVVFSLRWPGVTFELLATARGRPADR